MNDQLSFKDIKREWKVHSQPTYSPVTVKLAKEVGVTLPVIDPPPRFKGKGWVTETEMDYVAKRFPLMSGKRLAQEMGVTKARVDAIVAAAVREGKLHRKRARRRPRKRSLLSRLLFWRK